ncbi:FeS assembly SUF system protein [Rhizobium sp. EC-SD404]|nr:FeS assembly SUF system protein [Rhizobium sp. EC-SD404]
MGTAMMTETTAKPDESSETSTVGAAEAVTGAAPVASAIPQEELARMTDDIIAALKTVYDPEIPADIYELGLIYKIDIEDDRMVKVDMTLTAPGCPVAGEMPGWVENAVGTVEGVSGVDVKLTFDPPWTPARMSEEAQVAVGWY